MYHQVPIEKLSRPQILKLLKGERVRVKHGKHHNVHVSEEHAKKIHKASMKGAGVILQLDPYACEMNEHMRGESCGDGVRKRTKVGRALFPAGYHGDGILSSIKKGVKRIASNPHARALLHQGVSHLAHRTSQRLSHPLAQQLLHSGEEQLHSQIDNYQGEGIMSSIKKGVRKIASNPHARALLHQGVSHLTHRASQRLSHPLAQQLLHSGEEQLHSQIDNYQGEGLSRARPRPRGRGMKHVGRKIKNTIRDASKSLQYLKPLMME